MAYVERRVFYGKVGLGTPLIEHLRQFKELAGRYGLGWEPRILSDFNSGRTDRIVMEAQADDIQELFPQGPMTSSPEAEQAFSAWNDKLNELIHYAEVELWQVQA